MRLVLLGPPGGGKGTQAVRLAEAFHVPHISTGDLFRAEMAQETELGKLAKSYISRGDLVPDEVVNDMVRRRLSQGDCEGFILDGVPRTSEQALVLETLLEELQRPITVVVNLEVPAEVIVERASGRQVCTECGAIFHATAKPPKVPGICDLCSGVLSVRADDQPETVRHRLKVYQTATAPVVGFYAERGLLQTVNGVGDPEEIFARICAKADRSCYN